MAAIHISLGSLPLHYILTQLALTAQVTVNHTLYLHTPQVASIMNANFVSVKVDREERPDVDKVYMSFVQALTGGGGWPMSVFLTPELKVR